MKAYRAKYKTPAQVHESLNLGKPKLRRCTSLNRDRSDPSPNKAALEEFRFDFQATQADQGFEQYQDVPQFDSLFPSELRSGEPFLPTKIPGSPSGDRYSSPALGKITGRAAMYSVSPDTPRAGVGRRNGVGRLMGVGERR